MTRRYSLFNIGDGGQALRELESESRSERWLTSHEGAVSILNGMFLDCEEEFLSEREVASQITDFPNSVETAYDLFMLNIRRNQLAAELIMATKEKYHDYIKARAKMEIAFPPVCDLWQVRLDSLITEYQARKEGEDGTD